MKTGPKPKPLAERFWAKIAKADSGSCWPWLGYKMKNGYGKVTVGSRTDGSKHQVLAHRLAYELTYGPIVDEMYVCHTCDNQRCCNPSHLFLGDQFRNMQDAANKGRLHGNGISGDAHYLRLKTHCKSGHPYDEVNTCWLPDGTRQCRICNRLRGDRFVLAHAKTKKSDSPHL